MSSSYAYLFAVSSVSATDDSNSLNASADAALQGWDIQLNYTTKRWAIVNGDMSLTKGQNAIEQAIDLRINLFLGEYFPDTTEGTPWYEQIFIKPVSTAIVNTIIRNRILGVPGVITVNTVTADLNRSTREFVLNYDVTTDVGQIISSTKVTT